MYKRQAFSNSMVGLVHAIGHALGGVCHVPHGDAMTILLPHCMEFNMDTIGHLYGRLYLHLGGYENFVKAKVEDYGRLSVQTVRDMTARYHEFCNLPITLSQAGVKKAVSYTQLDVYKRQRQNHAEGPYGAAEKVPAPIGLDAAPGGGIQQVEQEIGQ